jgi:cytochrome c oxidase subunit 3
MNETMTSHPIPTSLGVDTQKLGIWTLLGSEAVFFSALIVTYMINRGHSTTGLLPHQVLDIGLTAFNTFVLLASSLTMVTALASIDRGNLRGVRIWLIATAVLGLTFLSGQAYEFNKLFHEGVTLSSNLFGATFFTLTGFHGAHVFAGVIWITFVVTRAFRGSITREKHIAVELVGLYWHFVDLVWIIIFTMVYLL